MLHTRWSAEAWAQVRVEFRRALALRSEIRRAGWFNRSVARSRPKKGRESTPAVASPALIPMVREGQGRIRTELSELRALVLRPEVRPAVPPGLAIHNPLRPALAPLADDLALGAGLR